MTKVLFGFARVGRFAGVLGISSVLVAAACDSDGSDGGGGKSASTGGTAGSGTSTGGTAGSGAPSGGKGGASSTGGASGKSTGGEPSGGEPGGGEPGGGDAGSGAGETGQGGSDGGQGGDGGVFPDLGGLVEHGVVTTATTARSAFGTVIVASDGERVYAVESRRDVETGPFGLPWRSRFRVAAYDGETERWAFAAPPDDVVSDVAVHPSGDVTIAVLHEAATRMAYDLVRFDRNGTPLGTTPLAEPGTAPAGDYGTGPRPLFRMKSETADATVGGWVRLIAHGEGLDVAFLSFVDVPDTNPLSRRFALGVESLAWRSGAYAERWGRVVEGPHRAEPVAWTYDEFRWREQPVRPFFARDEVTGELVVGRGWNNTRCQANVAVFAEFTAQDCVLGTVGTLEVELLPLAVTRFDADGARLGTRILVPDEDAAEQVPFALTANDGTLAVSGSVVRKLADGSRRIYDPGGYVDYDGYIAIYDGEGRPVRHHDYNQGHGDVLAGLRFTAGGIVAVGAAGWDRWQGGMSISRGADPLIAWLSPDGSRFAARVVPMSNGSRHYNLHDVTILGHAIVAQGFSDAPMTHSADGGNDAARTFGTLHVRLDEP